MNADVVFSFNYTTTELLDNNLRNARTFHVHGSVMQPEKIVLGIDRLDDEQDKFIYWTKPFQRIHTQQDPGYRDYIVDSPANPYAVTVFGHSLDSIDAYILCPLLECADQITIYYHDRDEYEQKVVNLIRLLGQTDIEDRVYEKRIIFKST